MRFYHQIDYRFYGYIVIAILLAMLAGTFFSGCAEDDKRLENERRAKIRMERICMLGAVAVSFMFGVAIGSSHRRLPYGSVE